MLKRPSRWDQKPHEDHEDWLMSYADMITLLLTFFALLLSMSKIDPVKMEQVQDALAREVLKKDVMKPLEQMKTDLREEIKTLKLNEDQIGVGFDDRGVVIDLDAGTFFDTGSAQLKPESLIALQQISKTLSVPLYDGFQIEVQGHTDDTPIPVPAAGQPPGPFPTNWELSGARASAVVRYLITQGQVPTRLSAMGFAETRPKVPNRDPNGNPLARNQAINRRVAVHVFPR